MQLSNGLLLCFRTTLAFTCLQTMSSGCVCMFFKYCTGKLYLDLESILCPHQVILVATRCLFKQFSLPSIPIVTVLLLTVYFCGTSLLYIWFLLTYFLLSKRHFINGYFYNILLLYCIMCVCLYCI